MEVTEVLRILNVIGKNVQEGPVAVKLPDSVPCPEGYRGGVAIDPAQCLACGTCAYVCVSNAITGGDEGANYIWTYEPGRCTFCARCVDHCPGNALSMEAKPVPSYFNFGELGVRQSVPLPLCVQCGAPVRPTTERFLNRAFSDVTQHIRESVQLCERCRRYRLQKNLFLSGTETTR
jgi:formate hydrogenlyase subunit 6/NADH:ubiquinone oxidoreductase subunit I